MMRKWSRQVWIWWIALAVACAPPEQAETEQLPKHSGFYKPWESLEELFHEVQMARVFPDSKTFVDCSPKREPALILADYRSQKDHTRFNLAEFVKANFNVPGPAAIDSFQTAVPVQQHLNMLWDHLTRPAGSPEAITTLIPLPKQYVVPGGRFREIYYWDSYFTMIGLGVSGRTDLIKSMVDNFAYLIDTVGFIPNGNRTYYLSRSQPPFFASMVNLLGGLTSKDDVIKYLPAMQQEYDFWMRGSRRVTEDNPAINHVVRLPDGTILNRYWDELDIPRPESYREDVELAHGLGEDDKKQLYRNLRAGAASGWDYSTRWFADSSDFKTIRTVDILPVDLNCLLYATELILADLYQEIDQSGEAKKYAAKAKSRKAAIQKYFWDSNTKAFTDYLWKEQQRTGFFSLAGAFPLYFNAATDQQAKGQAQLIKSRFFLPGGLVTTSIASGQQWDAPNGWAPLQWMAIKGLQEYGEAALAGEIAAAWIRTNEKVFANTGKMMEKYNVSDTTLLAGGGEYPTQDGFGWTNGVLLGLLSEEAVY